MWYSVNLMIQLRHISLSIGITIQIARAQLSLICLRSHSPQLREQLYRTPVTRYKTTPSHLLMKTHRIRNWIIEELKNGPATQAELVEAISNKYRHGTTRHQLGNILWRIPEIYVCGMVRIKPIGYGKRTRGALTPIYDLKVVGLPTKQQVSPKGGT